MTRNNLVCSSSRRRIVYGMTFHHQRYIINNAMHNTVTAIELVYIYYMRECRKLACRLWNSLIHQHVMSKEILNLTKKRKGILEWCLTWNDTFVLHRQRTGLGTTLRSQRFPTAGTTSQQDPIFDTGDLRRGYDLYDRSPL